MKKKNGFVCSRSNSLRNSFKIHHEKSLNVKDVTICNIESSMKRKGIEIASANDWDRSEKRDSKLISSVSMQNRDTRVTNSRPKIPSVEKSEKDSKIVKSTFRNEKFVVKVSSFMAKTNKGSNFFFICFNFYFYSWFLSFRLY